MRREVPTPRVNLTHLRATPTLAAARHGRSRDGCSWEGERPRMGVTSTEKAVRTSYDPSYDPTISDFLRSGPPASDDSDTIEILLKDCQLKDCQFAGRD